MCDWITGVCFFADNPEFTPAVSVTLEDGILRFRSENKKEEILLLKEKNKQNDEIISLSKKLKELEEKFKELEGKTEV